MGQQRCSLLTVYPYPVNTSTPTYPQKHQKLFELLNAQAFPPLIKYLYLQNPNTQLKPKRFSHHIHHAYVDLQCHKVYISFCIFVSNNLSWHNSCYCCYSSILLLLMFQLSVDLVGSDLNLKLHPFLFVLNVHSEHTCSWWLWLTSIRKYERLARLTMFRDILPVQRFQPHSVFQSFQV